MAYRLTMPKMMLLLAEVIVFAILAVAASHHFGLHDGVKITVAYLFAYIVPRTVLSHAKDTSLTAHIVLLVLAIFLMIVGYDCLLRWTAPSGYSLQLPDLESDARKYYKWALSYYDGRIESPQGVAFPGYPLMLVYLWKLFGLSVIWPLALNTMFTLTSVVLTGMTTRRLLSHRVSVSSNTLLWGSMLLSCLLWYYLMIGICILKEGTIYLSMAMAGFSLSSMASTDNERFRLWRDLAIFTIACLLMAIVRPTFLYFILIGIFIMVIPHWRRDWIMAVTMIAILILTLFAGNEMASYSFEHHSEIVEGGWSMQNVYIESYSQRFYLRLIGLYFLYSPLHKIALLPLTMSVQFMIPFPWIIDEEFSLLNIIARGTYGWYIIGGIALFYYFYMSWRRDENMGAWAWWPAVAFVALAYIMAGSVARYALPIEPLFIPVAIFTMCRLRDGHRRKAFKWWSIIFMILLIITLLICLEIQNYTFSTMFHADSLRQFLSHLIPHL